MPVQRNYTFDLSSEEVCNLLRSEEGAGKAQYCQAVDIMKSRVADGYEHDITDTRLLIGSRQKLKFFAYGTRNVALLSRERRLIDVYPIEDCGIVNVQLQIEAILSTRLGLDPAMKAAIINAFRTTPLSMTEVDQAETAMIRAGAGIQDYWVDLALTLDRDEFQIERTHVDQFKALMADQKDLQGRKVYIVEERGNVVLSCSSNVPPLPASHVIEVHQGDDVGKTIIDHENAVNRENCDGLVVTDHVIGTAFLIPETMLRWELIPIVVCGKQIGSMHLPFLFKRQRPAVLHGIVASLPDAKNYYEDNFRECIVVSAITTGALAIVTGFGGLAAAAAAFQTALTLCISDKIKKSQHCIIPDLQLIVEDRPWDPV